MGRSDPPGHTKVTIFTTNSTTLNQYTHYTEESEDSRTKYHQYRIKSTNLIDSYESFKDGRRGLRNTQDYIRDQSYILRDNLREYWKQQYSTLQPIAEGTSLPVPDSQANPYENTNPYQADYRTSVYEETALYEETAPYEETALYKETAPYEETALYKETATYEDEADYEVVNQPYSKHRLLSKYSSSKHSIGHLLSKYSSSKSLHQASSSDSYKRKALQLSPLGSGYISKYSSKRSIKHKSYWKLDDQSGYYYYKHSDSTIS
jgi:hypothetical protein